MRLNDDVLVLALTRPLEDGGQAVYNPSLILDSEQGPTLVDTGLPGHLEQISAALREAGVRPEDLKRIIITHQDIDHVGTLHDLVEASGARVLAGEAEARFIDGTELPRFARPEVLAARPELRAVVERLQPTHVDEPLSDGARLEIAGGVRAVFTPGHTPGHICLYLERSKTLIAGDALTSSEGRQQGPSPNATMDMATAMDSVRKLSQLDVRAIINYHGGAVQDDAGGQLRRLAVS